MAEAQASINLNPDILKNMPQGLNVLFGTGDNSINNYLKNPKLKRCKENGNTIIKPEKANVSNAASLLYDPETFVTSVRKQQLPDYATVELAAFGPQPVNKGASGADSFTFNADYFYSYSSVNNKALSKNNLYVGGVPPSYTETDLHNIFKEYGEISSVYITRAGAIAFVEYTDPTCAQRAVLEQNNNIPPNGKWPWIVKRANYNSVISQRQTG